MNLSISSHRMWAPQNYFYSNVVTASIAANLQGGVSLPMDNLSPKIAIVHLTGVCNLSCRGCNALTNENRNKKGERGFEFFDEKDNVSRFVGAFARMGGKAIHISGGGEPTVSENFSYFIDEAVRNNLRIGVVTNGVEIIRNDSIAEALGKYPAWVRLSIHGAKPKTYEKMHGKNVFVNVVAGLEKLLWLRDKYNRLGTIGVSFLCYPQNYEEILEFTELMYRYGVDYVRFDNYAPPRGRLFRSDEEFHAYSESRNNLQKKAYLQFNQKKQDGRIVPFRVVLPYSARENMQTWTSVDQSATYRGCPMLAHDFLVTYTGDITACCTIPATDRTKLGDLKTQSLEDILLGEKRILAILSALDRFPCVRGCTHEKGNLDVYNAVERGIPVYDGVQIPDGLALDDLPLELQRELYQISFYR